MNIDHLKDKFDLNELEVSLLEYIKKNQKQLKNITIRQMAKDNFTSTSAIYRLCNKLEFSGYSDMIYHLSSNTHNNAPAQKYENYLPHFIQLLNNINYIFHIFHDLLFRQMILFQNFCHIIAVQEFFLQSEVQNLHIGISIES